MDRLDPKRRSENMSRIRNKDTQPEIAVRSVAHALGYRYRLHVKTLPGKPDMVFPARKAIIFVHGCFWHLHAGCREGRIPATKKLYWEAKLRNNVIRDRAHIRDLRKLGWRVLIIWECEVHNRTQLVERLTHFLD